MGGRARMYSVGMCTCDAQCPKLVAADRHTLHFCCALAHRRKAFELCQQRWAGVTGRIAEFRLASERYRCETLRAIRVPSEYTLCVAALKSSNHSGFWSPSARAAALKRAAPREPWGL